MCCSSVRPKVALLSSGNWGNKVNDPDVKTAGTLAIAEVPAFRLQPVGSDRRIDGIGRALFPYGQRKTRAQRGFRRFWRKNKSFA